MDEREMSSKDSTLVPKSTQALQLNQIGIKVSNLNAKWNSSSEEMTLSNISLEVKRGQLVAIIGTVGAAKVLFLSARA
jgi:ABC-type glutathione transport system ATPase component